MKPFTELANVQDELKDVDPGRRNFAIKRALQNRLDFIFDAKVCMALSYMFFMPWFDRLWTVQEITVSQNALVMFGKFALD